CIRSWPESIGIQVGIAFIKSGILIPRLISEIVQMIGENRSLTKHAEAPIYVLVLSEEEIALSRSVPEHGKVKVFVIEACRDSELVSRIAVTNNPEIARIRKGIGAVVYFSITIDILIAYISGTPYAGEDKGSIGCRLM